MFLKSIRRIEASPIESSGCAAALGLGAAYRNASSFALLCLPAGLLLANCGAEPADDTAMPVQGMPTTGDPAAAASGDTAMNPDVTAAGTTVDMTGAATTATLPQDAPVPTPTSTAAMPSGSASAVPTTTGPGTPPPDLPGVVTAGMCAALCATDLLDPDGNGDDWGWENDASCVLKTSTTALTSFACITGQPLPAPMALTGPGIVSNSACVRLCTGTDPDLGLVTQDDWGWEFETTCVFPGTTTALAAMACTLGEEVPVISSAGLPGRLLGNVCNPYCLSEASDAAGVPAGDGWGWEYGAYGCLVEGSAPAVLGLDCVVGEDLVLTAPALNPNPPAGEATRPAGNTSTGFFVDAGQLYDAYGNPFVIRGVNNAHVWFDTFDQYFAYQALDNIAALGANAIRVVWDTTGTATLLRQVVARIVELEMVPILEMHDVTGGTSNADLLAMAAYYAQVDVKAVLVDFEGYLLVNIANEWSGTDFANGYSAAIAQLRADGILNTLVIDAGGFGQDADSILNNGEGLLNGDPQHNLMFSLHMYANYTSTDTITQVLDQIAGSGLAVMVGEFGPQHGDAMIDANHIMAECERLGLGTLAWSWKGNNADLAYLDMAVDWEGVQLTTWGSDAFTGPNGISNTAQPASIFAP